MKAFLGLKRSISLHCPIFSLARMALFLVLSVIRLLVFKINLKFIGFVKKQLTIDFKFVLCKYFRVSMVRSSFCK